MDLFDLLLLSSVLYKHMDGLNNDVERSNEMVRFIIIVVLVCCLPVRLKVLNWPLPQVAILHDELEEKDLEIRRLKELLSQKEYTEERASEKVDEARNDLNTASDPPQDKVES
jgi:pre-mRNA-splicing regulator WTAP